jgi:tetratricopeptide (TPR) repeat protein
MKAWACRLALGLLLSTAIPTVAVVAAESAEQVLLDKANYWRLKDRPDLAASALDQLLAINPSQPDALFQYGMLSVQLNKVADAQRYLTKLQQVAPDSPHIPDLQNAIRAGQIGPSDIGEARRLVQAGQLSEAVEKYRQIFRGPPPSSFAVEYYMTLGGTPQGWDEARQGLEKLVQSSPNDPRFKLALAEIYTYREPTRMQGITSLMQLSKDPIVGADAVKAWRQSLTWMNGSSAAKGAIQQYLAQYPQDSEIQQLLTDLAKQPAGGSEAQSKAYADLQHGNLAAAERQFASDLRANPNDPQALAGLGLVRLRQNRFVEARDLLGRAIKAAPDQQKEIEPAYQSAVFWAQVQTAKGLAAQKNYAGAETILSRLLANPRSDNWGAELVLGDVEAKLGHQAAAEAAYRRALRARPGNPDALFGLAAALRAQNKTEELNQLTARMSPAERARMEQAGSGNSEGEKLRKEAKEASANGNIPLATAKFQAAIAADPRNPWIRLDYARFLAGQGNTTQAYAAVDPAATGNTPLSILVSAMFDSQQDHWAEALDKVDAIPPAQRTEDIKNFRDRVYVRGTIEKAKRLAATGQTAGARKLLVDLYDDPGVKTDEKREAPFVLAKNLKDIDTALQITRAAYQRGGPDSVKAGADYAMLLLIAGHHDADAAAVIAKLDTSGQLNDNNREGVVPVRILLAVKRADDLRDKGDYAAAWDQISQLLIDQPDDTNLMIEAGRIYASGGRRKEALDYFDKAYQQDSGNITVLRGVVSGLILAREYGKAQGYLDKGIEADPENPWMYLLQAQIDEARGNNGAALRALMKARALNQQQNGGTSTPSAADVTGPAPGAPPPAQPALPSNPFRQSEAAPQAPPAIAARVDNVSSAYGARMQLLGDRG